MSKLLIAIAAASSIPRPEKKISVSNKSFPKISYNLPGAILLISSICHNLSWAWTYPKAV